MVGIAQSARATGCGPVGRGFESLYPPHMKPCDALLDAARYKYKDRLHAIQPNTGASPSGKASAFDADIRWFESSRPCHFNLT